MHSPAGSGKADQVAVRIFDDEASLAPGLGAQRLVEFGARRLEFEIESLDVVDAEVGCQKVLICRAFSIAQWLVCATQRELEAVARDLREIRRLAIGPGFLEAEHAGVPLTRALDFLDDDVRNCPSQAWRRCRLTRRCSLPG